MQTEIRAELTTDFNYQISLLQEAHDATKGELDQLKNELREKETEIGTLRKEIKVSLKYWYRH